MELPNAGPISHPKNVAPKVASPMLMKGSVGTNFVMLSASSGISEKAAIAPTVDAAEVRIEDARAYRRRLVRRRKKLFQSSSCEAGESEEIVDVEEFRVRHSEGVKNDDGVLVEEGGFAARGRYGLCWPRAADEMSRCVLEETLFENLSVGRE